jgi:hypothetical protein
MERHDAIYVWSERLPLEVLSAPTTLGLLRARGLRLLAAITPATAGRAIELLAACRACGVWIGLWPMIEDERGRWANAWTAPAFAAFSSSLLATLRRVDLLPDELVLDLEPPIWLIRPTLRGRPRFLLAPAAGCAQLLDLAAHIRDAGITLSAAAVPPAALGTGRRGWQRLLGTPLDELPLDRVSVMAYTSLLEGYSRGFLRRRDAESLLRLWARALSRGYGRRGGLSLGAVGRGALGDEAVYRSPAELARDAAIARSEGVTELALFCLEGVLARPPAEAWLDALIEPEPIAADPVTRRARWVWRATSLVGSAKSSGRGQRLWWPGGSSPCGHSGRGS